MSEVFTVFYCWQSDTPSEHCRHLVREALDKAADAVTKDEEVPFRLLIQADTEGEPGLCNIPATILKRLRESDAVVSDLTFVASTEGPKSKYCSNPNVLFELGYAFAHLGPERLICVMNEVHGLAARQIFDLAHHRRPIRFRSPRSSKSRPAIVKSLAKSLETALRDATKLGRAGATGGDDEIRHERQLADVVSYWESVHNRAADAPRIRVVFRPKRFRDRWVGFGTLEKVVREFGPLTDRHHRYPPQPTGNAAMDWGLYNDTYGDPWTLTYSGQFWTEIEIGGKIDHRLENLTARVSPEPPRDPLIRAGRWVMGDHALGELSKAFQFARDLSMNFSNSEELLVRIEATGLKDKWLNFANAFDFGPSKATGIRREFDMTVSEFHETWERKYAYIGKEICDLFSRDGREVSLNDVKDFQNVAGRVARSKLQVS